MALEQRRAKVKPGSKKLAVSLGLFTLPAIRPRLLPILFAACLSTLIPILPSLLSPPPQYLFLDGLALLAPGGVVPP